MSDSANGGQQAPNVAKKGKKNKKDSKISGSDEKKREQIREEAFESFIYDVLKQVHPLPYSL